MHIESSLERWVLKVVGAGGSLKVRGVFSPQGGAGIKVLRLRTDFPSWGNYMGVFYLFL